MLGGGGSRMYKENSSVLTKPVSSVLQRTPDYTGLKAALPWE